jgi:hypothetical protein
MMLSASLRARKTLVWGGRTEIMEVPGYGLVVQPKFKTLYQKAASKTATISDDDTAMVHMCSIS